jgi:diguanylate cyclase (GGDEF)-like protein/PAS domain S-box-containing protein
LGLAVAIASWFSLTYTRFEAGVSSVWIANGLLCGALLLAPRAQWRWYFLAGFAGQVLVRAMKDPPYAVAIIATANMLECALVAFWIRRHENDLARARSLTVVARDALLSTLVACAGSGMIASPIVSLRTGASPFFAWLTWFGAHVLGLVIVATLVVCAFQKNVRMIPDATRERWDYFGCLSLLMLVCWVVFEQHNLPVLFLIFLPLLLLAWRHGLSGRVVGVSVLALTSAVPAANGSGPFALLVTTNSSARLLFWQLFISSACVLAYSSAVSLTRRQQLERKLLRSESRYRLLADYSHDLIVQRVQGKGRVYVSPASLPLLGYAPDNLPPTEELIHPDDVARVTAEFGQLFSGVLDSATLLFRARHRRGHWLWLEAAAQAIDGEDGRSVIYTSRDVTERIAAEQATAAAQAQLQAITDHLPAMVARFDRDARYLYANSRSLAMVPHIDIIGKTLPELRGPSHYAQFKPMVDAVLRGESQAFDTWMTGPTGQRIELRAQFVPDRGADGRVQGFYSLAFDITEAKNFARELERLARVDALTGLANRRQFEEELAAAVARATRTGAALMVVSLDLDKFKQINDTLGHAAGDEVLVEFARRVRASVYNVDLVARLGGDEFVVLVQYSATAESGERIAKQILAAMVPPMTLTSGPVQAATSIGVGLQQPVTSAADLLALADRALYEAKARGRNTYSVLRE